MADWKPIWNDTVKIESGGRHPLLLNRFHNHLEELLIKGIVSTTDRLRYISYCCWIIGDIENTLNCNNYNDFLEAFRRRENALAIGSYLLKPEDTIYGAYRIYGRVTLSNIVSDELNNYNCSFQLMQSAKLGAYELYYSGTIFNWGLVWQDENGVIKLTETGKELYNIVQSYYKSSKYYNIYKGEKTVPRDVLKEWAEINCYDNITDDSCDAEREFYKKIIFRLNGTKEVDYRRDTFAFFLECINQCDENKVCFDEDILRNINYYNNYYGNNGQVKNFHKPTYFDDVAFYWEIYELQVYFRWWISEYFRYFLTILKSKDNGMSIEEFINAIDSDGFNVVMAECFGENIDYYNSDISTMFNYINKIANIDESFSEEAITANDGFINTSEDLAKFVLIIIGLFQKYKSIKNDQRYIWVRSKLMEDYWFDSLFLEMESLRRLKMSEFLKYILKKYIIDKHDLRMYEKRDLRRCWFTKENNNYLFEADESPIWRPAKFRITWSFLLDMRLIEYSDDILKLTEDGNILYKYLKMEFYI